jgi:hypothetical protein
VRYSVITEPSSGCVTIDDHVLTVDMCYVVVERRESGF